MFAKLLKSPLLPFNLKSTTPSIYSKMFPLFPTSTIPPTSWKNFTSTSTPVFLTNASTISLPLSSGNILMSNAGVVGERGQGRYGFLFINISYQFIMPYMILSSCIYISTFFRDLPTFTYLKSLKFIQPTIQIP